MYRFRAGSWSSEGSPFYIGELRGHFSIAHGEHVHAAEVPGLAVAELAIHPTHDGTIAAHDHILGLEHRIGIVREPRPPERDHRGLALDPPAVRRGRRVLEYGVIGEPRRQGVRVVTIECFVEAIDDHAGGWRRH